MVRYVAICLASWAYIKTFIKTNMFDDEDMRNIVEMIFADYTRPFTIDFFTGDSAPLLLDPNCFYTRIIAATIHTHSMMDIFSFNIYVRQHVHVFPRNLLTKKAGNIFSWCVVKRGSDIVLDNGTRLTFKLVDKVTRRARCDGNYFLGL